MDYKHKTERKQQWYKILLRVKYFLMLLSFSRPEVKAFFRTGRKIQESIATLRSGEQVCNPRLFPLLHVTWMVKGIQ